MPLDLAAARQRAQELTLFADGYSERGYDLFAARARMVCRDLQEALVELESERAGRRAMQAQRDRLERILLGRGALDVAANGGMAHPRLEPADSEDRTVRGRTL